MDDGPAGHAMTENALALAMGFFCLLVLTMSMGAPVDEIDNGRIAALAAANGPGAKALAPTDRLVVFHRGRFLDSDRRPVEPDWLAVDPALPMAAALAARGRIAAQDLVLAPLDAAWLAALAEGGAR